jgi:hypothetical protein
MLLKVDAFGGVVPKVLDPVLLTPNKSQVAENVRLDRGGITPLSTDLIISGATVPAGTKSLFIYYQPKNPPTQNFLSWLTDVDVVKSPIPNDQFNRIYYTENGLLKATGLTPGRIKMLPGEFYYPCPPAPNSPMTVALPPATTGSGNLVVYPDRAAAGDFYSTTTTPIVSHSPGNCVQDVPDKAIFWQTDKAYNIERAGIVNDLNPSGGNNAFWQYDLETFWSRITIPFYSPNALTMWFDDTQTQNCGPAAFTVLASDDPTFPPGTDSSGNPRTVILSAATGVTWGGTFESQTWTWEASAHRYRYIRILVTASDKDTPPTYSNKHLQINAIQLIWNPPTPDLTLAQTKAFTYTLVNEYGQEGPPWVPGEGQSQIVSPFYEGNVLHFEVQYPFTDSKSDQDWDPKYKLKYVRVYLSNETSSGTSQFQLVTEFELAEGAMQRTTFAYDHAIYSSNLGVVCPSLDWSQPPGYVNGIPVGDSSVGPGLHGLNEVPGGIIGGFSGNQVCLSVPNFPHAWPVTQQYAVDTDVVGIGGFGTTIVALTLGQPYLAVGNDPANVVMEKIGDAMSCLSKRGIVSVNGTTIYPCPEGLKAIGPSIDDVLTKDLMTKEQWAALYNPSSINAYYWEGKYVSFYQLSSGARGGFLFDLKTKDLINLNTYCPSGYYDPANGRLNLVSSSYQIVGWNEGPVFKSAKYKTKRFKFAKTSFSCIKVLATAYPVYVDVIYPEAPLTMTIQVISDKPQRLPSKLLVDTVDIDPYSNGRTSGEVSAILLASVLEEIPI